jgi:hypothetical protein
MPKATLTPPFIGLDEVQELMEWVGLAETSRKTDYSQTPSDLPDNRPSDLVAPSDEPD